MEGERRTYAGDDDTHFCVFFCGSSSSGLVSQGWFVLRVQASLFVCLFVCFGIALSSRVEVDGRYKNIIQSVLMLYVEVCPL